MKAISTIAASLLAYAVADNQNRVLAPPDSKAGLDEKMFVLIPGANVPTANYIDTAKAIQEQADLKLWVVIPEIADKFCISVCPAKGKCGHLYSDVNKVIGMATE